MKDQKFGGVQTHSTVASVLPVFTRLCGPSGLKEKLSPLRTLYAVSYTHLTLPTTERV